MGVSAGAALRAGVTSISSRSQGVRFQRILVTGGTGFLGRHVVDILRSKDVEVQSCSRREGVDIRDARAFLASLHELKRDCVVHCAAHTGGINYVQSHAIEIFEDNLQIALGLVRGVDEAGVPFLLNIMPNCTYPGDKQIYREAEWWDGALHDSVLMYGLPRKTLWGLAATYGQRRGLRCGHLIFPNLYGPGDHFDPKKSHALGALVAKIVRAKRENRKEVDLWGSGKPVREWMYVGNAAAAIPAYLNQLLQSPPENPAGAQIYNVGIGEGISIRELAEQIKNAAGWEGRFVFDTSKPDGAMQKLLDGRGFAELIAWKPPTPLVEGIAETVRWYEAHHPGQKPKSRRAGNGSSSGSGRQ